MFDLNKLKQLDEPTSRAEAIDLLMNYWDEEFSNGRFDEFERFKKVLDWDSYSASVVCCIHTVGWWIHDKFDFQSLCKRVRIYYTDKGFEEKRIESLMRGMEGK